MIKHFSPALDFREEIAVSEISSQILLLEPKDLMEELNRLQKDETTPEAFLKIIIEARVNMKTELARLPERRQSDKNRRFLLHKEFHSLFASQISWVLRNILKIPRREGLRPILPIVTAHQMKAVEKFD